MKILFVSEVFYPRLAGGQISSWAILNGLAEKGHEIQVITGKIPGTKKYEIVNKIKIVRPAPSIIPEMNQKGIKIITSIFKRFIFMIRIYVFLNNYLKSNKIDIIYNMGYITEIPVNIISLKYKISSVSSIRVFVNKEWFKIFNPILAAFCYIGEIFFIYIGRHKSFHCPSKKVANKIEKYSSVPTCVIPNPVNSNLIQKSIENSSTIRSNLGIKEDELFILFVGSLAKVKNIYELVQVISKLDEKIKLIIVGEGPERSRIMELSKKVNINNVRLLGQKPHEETMKIMNSCDVLILPSKSEVFPNVVIEALALNKLVIATKVGDIECIKSENLYLVNSVDEINYLIIKIIKKEIQNINDGDAILKEYSLNKITNEFEDFFQRCINN